MKKGSKLAILIGVVAAIAAVVASLSALLLYLDSAICFPRRLYIL